MSDGTKSETLTAIAAMIGSESTPETDEEWQEAIDAFAGRNVTLGRATSDYWMNECIKLRTQLSLSTQNAHAEVAG